VTRRKPQAASWQYHAALIPIRWHGEETAECGRPIFMYASKDEQPPNKDEQRTFYMALLELWWLAPEVRSAIRRKLGLSLLQEEKRKVEEAQTEVFRMQIEEAKARMREHGERPNLGIDDAAYKEVAALHGMKVQALQQRIYRLDHLERRPRRRGNKAAKDQI
jgi:hypothetical protein